jgi:multidrug efflux pump subunit AcrA (membrane-fusion protein)
MASTETKPESKIEGAARSPSASVPIRIPSTLSETKPVTTTPPQKPYAKTAGIVLGVLLITIFVWQHFSSPVVDTSMKFATVEHSQFGGTLQEIGTIEALTETPVLSPFNGEVVWKIDDGTFVEAGEPIVRFDNSTLEEDLVTAEQNLKDREDGVRRVEAQLNYSRERYQCVVHQSEITLKIAELDRDDTYNFPHPADRQDGELALEAAALDLDASKHELEIDNEMLKRGFISEAKRKQQQLAVATKTVNYLKAKVIHDSQTQGATLEAKRVVDMAVKNAQKLNQMAVFNRDADEKVLKASLTQAKIQYENAARDLKRKRKVYDSAEIKSPVRGRASFIDVWKGPGKSNTPIQVGEQRPQGSDLCVVCDVSALRVRVLISEADVKYVAIGQEATIKLRAFPNTPFKAKVSKLALVAQDKNVALSGLASRRNGEAFVNVVEAKLDFEGLSAADMKKMRIGYTADVTINTSSTVDTLRIPWSAVVYDKDGVASVEVLDAGGTLQRRAVKLGRCDNNCVQVVDGVREGEKVRVSF